MVACCKNCKFSIWSVSIGQGHYCINPKNEGIPLSRNSRLYPNNYPQIPSRDFVCQYHEFE